MNREQRRLQEVEKRRQEKAEEAQKAKSGSKSAVQRAQTRRPAAAAGDKNIFQRIVQFLKEVRAEMRRVSWPTREQMVAFTTVTLITTTALTLLVFALDLGFKAGILFLLESGT